MDEVIEGHAGFQNTQRVEDHNQSDVKAIEPCGEELVVVAKEKAGASMALTDAQRESIYRLRLREPAAGPFLKHLEGLGHNMRETSLNVVETYSGLNRSRALELMRAIVATGVASIGGGGGGVASFLKWADGVDVREIGRDTNEPLR